MAIRSRETPIPGRVKLAAGLRQITEALAAEIETPTAAAPPWSEFQWGIARAVIAIHGIAGLLLRALRWAEPDWRHFLQSEVSDTREHHRHISAAIEELHALSQKSGIPVVVLKGSALHALGIYQPGERPMADVDILVRSADVGAMEELLARAGFVLRGVTWKHREFERMRDHSRVKIDLHTRLAERIASREFTLADDALAAVPGVRGYASRLQLLRHLLLHAAGNMSTRSARAIQLHDIARVSAQLEPAEWSQFRSDPWEQRWCFYPPLLLVSRYFPGVIDRDALAELAATCPSMLARVVKRQTLTDVSMSDPRQMALPELAWCTSMGTFLRYAQLRLLPGRARTEGLRRLADTEGFGRGHRWFKMSQPARIATWLFRKPMRPATLYAVRRGLAFHDVADSIQRRR
jgi:hypothetical protein